MRRASGRTGRALPAFSVPAALFFFLLLALAVVAAAPCLADAPAADAILGTWVVAEKDAHIEIYKQENRYCGRLSWLKDDDEKPGDRQAPKMHEAPRVGMVIVRDFLFNGREWRGGTLYDPTDGKSYKGIIRLDGKGRLHVRGYLGISLLGRTTVWQRVE
jgi:uncharacterized protein (DUF2147 family)